MKHKQKRHYGWIPDKHDHRDAKFKPKKIHGPLPMTYLYWKHQGVEIYDQGQLGSCTANGWADLVQYALKNKYTKVDHDVFVPSRLFIYYYERLMEHTIDWDSGAQIRDGAKVLAKFGVCPETVWPYDITRFAVKPSVEASRNAELFKAVIYERVDNTDREALVSALQQGFPIVFGFDVYEGFETTRDGDIALPKPGEAYLGGHCCTIRGYDPGRESRLNGKPYYFCKNSWGLNWGDQGHFRMDADYIEDPKMCGDFWILKEIS